MNEQRNETKGRKPSKEPFSESSEYHHEQNELAKAQKQMASQETAGLLDETNEENQ